MITREYPQNWDSTKEKFYPVTDDRNKEPYTQYNNRIETNRYIFGGRLANYKY